MPVVTLLELMPQAVVVVLVEPVVLQAVLVLELMVALELVHIRLGQVQQVQESQVNMQAVVHLNQEIQLKAVAELIVFRVLQIQAVVVVQTAEQQAVQVLLLFVIQ
jgi:hypothetical protein